MQFSAESSPCLLGSCSPSPSIEEMLWLLPGEPRSPQPANTIVVCGFLASGSLASLHVHNQIDAKAEVVTSLHRKPDLWPGKDCLPHQEQTLKGDPSQESAGS